MASKRPFESQPWSSCTRCKQEFFAWDRAQDHFETICPDLWCDICYESFSDPEHARQHMVIHRGQPCVCPRCGIDAATGDALIKHWIKTGCHQECPACKVWYHQESYEVHLELNPYCRRLTFSSEYARPSEPAGRPEPDAPYKPQVYKGTEVKKEDGMDTKPDRDHSRSAPSLVALSPQEPVSHSIGKNLSLPYKSANPPGISCYGCGKWHPYPASMINHLESGVCSSMINLLDVNYTFAIYPESEMFLLSDDRKSLGSLLNYEDIRRSRPFHCYGDGCGASFSFLSGLIQHIASTGCYSIRKIQDILDHLRINLYYQSVIRKIHRMGLTSPATIFVRPPPYQIFKDFERIPEPWRPMSSQLIGHILSAVSNVLCGKPDSEGQGFLTFKRPRDMDKILIKIGNAIGKLRGELRKVDLAKDLKPQNETCQILMYFKNTDDALTLDQFLDDAEKLKNVLLRELHRPMVPHNTVNLRVY